MLACIHTLEFSFAGQLEQVIGGAAGLAAPQTPWRAIDAARTMQIPSALDQIAHAEIDAEAAAKFARASGIGTQRSLFDQNGTLEFKALDRAIADVALTNRNGGRFAVLERPAAPSAAFQALHHESLARPGIHPEENDGAAEKSMVRRREFCPESPQPER